MLGAVAVLSGGWLILHAILRRFCLLLNTLQWNFTPDEAASIGIIGGADGPTAIFVAGVTALGTPDWVVILVAAVLVCSILALLLLNRKKT